MRLPVDPIGGPLPGSAAERAEHAAHIAELEARLEALRAEVRAGWGDARVRRQGKLTALERIDRLVDPGTEPRFVGTLVNHGRRFKGSRRPAPGAGVYTAFARVEGRWVMVIANDNTVSAGAWWPRTPEKIQRAQTMALRLRLPVVYLVDCSGLFLPEQSRSFAGRTGAGRIFRMNSVLSDAGVPQIAGVFGDSIAGGGYMPIISDRVYMTEQSYMVIAGAALIKGAKSQHLTSIDIGGPEVHVHQSGCADVRVPDDETCIARIREDVAKLPGPAVDFYRHGVEPEPPLYDPAELPQVFPRDYRQVYDVRQVIARLVDGSLFHEFLPHVGTEVVTGYARVSGLWVGIAANVAEPRPKPGGGARPGAILYREGVARLAAFSRACDADGVPLIWLQDVAGFDIGQEAEASGLLAYGSSLIYGNSTNRAPMFTVLLRRASGAGYYAMAGLPYDPVVQLSTMLTRQSVMDGQTLAIAAFNSKLDDEFRIATTDPVERAEIERKMAETAARIEADMDPVDAASRMDTDEVVRLAELRGWLELFAEAAYQSIGYRRVKNPRIWSVHDTEVLAACGPAPERAAEAAVTAEAGPAEGGEGAPVRCPMEGVIWTRPEPGAPPFARPGDRVEPGQTVALLEVMKTFTPVAAGAGGTWLRYAVEDGEPVGGGAVVGWIEPA